MIADNDHSFEDSISVSGTLISCGLFLDFYIADANDYDNNNDYDGK